MWHWLGRRESDGLREQLEAIATPAPIYVSGLARSGSTVLLEALASFSVCATHRYRDFPLVLTPHWWNGFLDRATRRCGAGSRERLHGDGIRITAESPEAMEEPLWMSFFPRMHDRTSSDVLDGEVRHDAFERFYGDHVRKVMLLRGGTHYLAKANYNITRLEYLLRLFPDARFIVPVRAPDAHVASLKRQHQRFCELHRADPRTLRYMQRLGHFEFGLDRRPIHVGVGSQAARIVADWEAGHEVDGLARLWTDVYGYLATRLEASEALREATLVVRHEDLVADPEAVLARVVRHCRLSVRYRQLLRLAEAFRRPPKGTALDAMDCSRVGSLVSSVAAMYGYRISSASGRFEAPRHDPNGIRIEGVA